jgi:short subunit dehydrogenase-like uncharacterized protein
MNRQWMIYGANGYTGRLTVAEAVKRGMRPVLAGRNRQALESMAADFGLDVRVFSLDNPENVRQGLDGMRLVLHCAGPFSATSHWRRVRTISTSPVRSACFATPTTSRSGRSTVTWF